MLCQKAVTGTGAPCIRLNRHDGLCVPVFTDADAAHLVTLDRRISDLSKELEWLDRERDKLVRQKRAAKEASGT